MRISGAAATLPGAPWVYFDPAKCMTSHADHGWLLTAERPETMGFIATVAIREHRAMTAMGNSTRSVCSGAMGQSRRKRTAAVAHHAGDSLANVIPNHERASIRSG
jgi:hypothetical protein